MSSYSREQLEAWLKTLDVKGSVLDIGGSQKPVKGRTNTWDVKEYKIFDLPAPHEQERQPDMVGYIDQKIAAWPKQFDNVFMLEVTEYLINPVKALENVHDALKKGGKLYISFHFIYPRHNPFGRDFLRYTPEGAEALLRYCGFDVIDNKERYTNTVQMVSIYREEKMKAIQGLNQNVIGNMIIAQKR